MRKENVYLRIDETAKSAPLSQGVWGLDELIWVKLSEQSLAQSKYYEL